MTGASATAEVLRSAKALIQRGWCQGARARDVRGDACSFAADGDATAWCATGALCGAACVDRETFLLLGHAAAIFEQVVGNHIAAWNDAPERTQEEVLAAFDRAIVLADAYAAD